MGLVLLAVAVLSAGIAWSTTRLLDDDATSTAEVFLEARATRGVDPFMPSATSVGVEAPSSPADEIPGASDTIRVSVVPGDQPGLYGGTPGESTCRADAIATFLEDNPDKAAAWAGVQGIGPTEIGSYLETLTPLVLNADTRVRNHGFRGGRATPRDAILERGTAVLIDSRGVPRVRCSCGNPLLPPAPAPRTEVQLVGTAWKDFDPSAVSAQKPAAAQIEAFEVTGSAGTFARPTGTSGEADEARDGPSATSPTTPPGPRPITADDVVTLEGVGPIRAGMTFEEVEATTGRPVVIDDYTESGGACVGVEFEGSVPGVRGIGGDGQLKVVFADATLRTDRGIGIGSTIDEVRAAYDGLLQEAPNYYSPDDLDLIVTDPTIPGRELWFTTIDDLVIEIKTGLTDYVSLVEGCA